MRQHPHSLLWRAGAFMRHARHFSHVLVRFVEVGLLRFRSSGETFLRGASDERRQRDSWGGATVTRDVNRLENKRLIISVHIPKTGGTVFGQVLKTIAQEVFYRDYRSESAPTAVRWRGKRVGTQLEAAPDPDSLSGRSVIHGHFRVSKYTSRFPNAVYVTWLRDPVDRVASHYFYWQQTPYPNDPHWKKVMTEKMSLEQFARSDFARDLQYRVICPLGVEGFAFIGITEEYERSLELFRRLICPNVKFDDVLKNYGPNRRANFYDLDPDLRKRILKLNERDAYTYVDGLRRFRRLCAQVGL